MSIKLTLKKILYLNRLINRPSIFNRLRYLVTGDQREIKKFVSENLQYYKCKSVVDICCGTGDFVQLNGIKYTGIDHNKSFISYACLKFNNKNISFIEGNALNLPFARKSFDVSLLISTLHHFSDQEANVLLDQVKRVTKKLVIIVDLLPYPVNKFKRLLVLLDQGSYVRTAENKEKIVNNYFYIRSSKYLKAQLSEHYGIIASLHE